jgi:glycosyltransferase involved in cell wall biosynthesis
LRIAINVKPVAGPWGGGNQFSVQLEEHLRARGHRVSYRLWPWTERILLVAPRPFQNVTFDVDDIRRFKVRHPSVTCVHRINQTNLGRGSTSVDDLFKTANEVADATVFISAWVRDYFAARWFSLDRPHTVIHNGADPLVFHPSPVAWNQREPCRVVTHHWSDNRNKGFAVYQEVDRLIADGELPGFDLTVIGRWPKDIAWRSAKTLSAMAPRELGEQLRQYHLYLTAAVAEAGGMHHIEGAQCGLPLVYHEDGGGVVELGRQYGVGFRDNVRQALLAARERYVELRERVVRLAPSGSRMCEEYERILTA